ncbi:hypothetical protein DHEL01_v208343 [Diaporthe helianthi]|uniref:FAD-binding PCMH-type domain-containing protein n=1 Tax=Diaporthe helianthi TaxID=158607 RepID=A0A2P5HSN5_DIAHE|nr:hypothetical protein DHEL01_v208343 [Diaporthe helianthi]
MQPTSTQLLGLLLASPLAASAAVLPGPKCKSTPSDASWPSTAEWTSLNASIDGRLLRTVPAASSCWPGNPFGSTIDCQNVRDGWRNGTWHSMQPESVDYPVWANNSCVPDEASGYSADRGCTIGGLAQYIVNATTEEHIATALKWASEHNIRVTVKGTGHDLNARSTGAFSLAIWTHQFRSIVRDQAWSAAIGNSTDTEDVFVVGSGQQWGNVLNEALAQGRIVTTGQDPSVGLGGYIQGGGHGPLASTFGLASNQVLQMRVVTTTGDILTANDFQNQDLFWALRGGGPGQYGVVTEYVIKHFPAPENVVTASFMMVPQGNSNISNQVSWEAAASIFSEMPDLMDAGLAGAATIATGSSAKLFFPTSNIQIPFKGVALNQIFWTFNKSAEAVQALVEPVVDRIQSEYNKDNSTLSISFSVGSPTDYPTFFKSISGDNAAGGQSLTTSRLLGRHELNDTPREKVASYLKTVLASQNETSGSFTTVGLSGGPGVMNAPEERWGAVLPAWRSAYLHVIATGASIETDAMSPRAALQAAAEWYEEVKEPMWREWSPDSGAYLNEGNPYTSDFQKTFYGDNYEKLLAIKKKYDPSETLYILSGVGSENWDYDLDTGKLCRAQG